MLLNHRTKDQNKRLHGYSVGLLTAVICISGLNPALAEDAVLEILRANITPQTTAQRTQLSNAQQADRGITRTGSVTLGADLLSPPMTSAARHAAQPDATLVSRSLAVEFFPDAYVEVVVSSESRPSPNTLSINGQAPDTDLSTFSLTLTPESYLITFSDPHSDALYRVVGETETGIGTVTEYNRRNQPAVIHEPPLIPPLD